MLSRLEQARAVSRSWWAWAGLGLLGFTAATFTIADADLWGHLRFGLDMLRDGRLTSVDPYSFTQDRPWVNHEWLSEIMMAAAYRMGGVPGLVILKGVMVFCALLIVWGALRDLRLPVRAAVMGLLIAGTVHATSSMRPQVWTFLFLAILCRVLGEDRSRRFLPLLFVVWVNSHGGWIVGLGVLGCWAVVESCLDRRTMSRWTVVVVACAAATLINPYGIRLWTFIYDTVGFNRAIQEWQPLFEMGADVWGSWCLGLTGALWISRQQHRHRWAALAVGAMLAFAAWRVMRINSLFLMASAILMAPALVGKWRAPLLLLPVRRPRGEAFVVLYVFAACVAVSAVGLRATTSCMSIRGPWAPSPSPVRLLASAPHGRMVTFFDWGEYALWHLGPGVKVSMDGRRETVYSNERLADHDAIVAGERRGFERLEQWRPDYVWLPVRSAGTRTWLEGRGYRVVWDDERGFLAVAPGVPSPATPSGWEPAPRCFPD